MTVRASRNGGKSWPVTVPVDPGPSAYSCLAALPDVPTFRELGYPLSVEVFYGIVGPAKLPPDAIQWWDALLAEISRTREYAELCDKIFALPSYADSASFKRMVTGGYAEFGKALTK